VHTRLLAAGLRRRAFTTAALVVFVLASTSAAGDSGPDFGTVGVDAKSYGTTVAVSTPSSLLFQQADEFIVHRDVVQSSLFASNPGLIQAGLYRSGTGIELDNCGPRSDYVEFAEIKAANSMAYKCQLFNPVSPGRIVTLDVFRFHAAGTWGIRFNGASTGSIYPLGFDKGSPAIGSEIADVDADFATHAATRFGPAGTTQWTVYRAPGRSQPRRVTGSTDPYPVADRFWTLPRPPARMTIRHRQ
jgi:hypothetical protein